MFFSRGSSYHYLDKKIVSSLKTVGKPVTTQSTKTLRYTVDIYLLLQKNSIIFIDRFAPKRLIGCSIQLQNYIQFHFLKVIVQFWQYFIAM